MVYAAILVCITLTACNIRSNNKCIPIEHAGSRAPILLFLGTGTSPCDVVALENILENNHLNYATANSAQMDSISIPQLQRYRLLIIPGGNFIDMGKSLSKETATNIRAAVSSGLNYFGICAGGFLAGNSSYYNGFNLTGGARFGFYSAAGKGLSKTVAATTDADGKTLDQYWENGPQFTGWGSVVGKYPDGTPAIVEGTCGKGFVILAGIHAEAPENWRGEMDFRTDAATDNAYAAMLIQAALYGNELQHY